MRFSAGSAANAAAWGIVLLLVLAAMMLTWRLGFVGLLLLGGATCLVCVLAELDRNVSTWGTEVFKARMSKPGSPEQKAAMLEEEQAFTHPLRFYRWCGVALMLLGGAGFAVQLWRMDGTGLP